MRRITIISSTRNDPQMLQSSARTWGELKGTIQSTFGDLSSLKVVEGTNRTTLEMDESVLPVGDFKIYLSQTKIKAGFNK